MNPRSLIKVQCLFCASMKIGCRSWADFVVTFQCRPYWCSSCCRSCPSSNSGIYHTWKTWHPQKKWRKHQAHLCDVTTSDCLSTELAGHWLHLSCLKGQKLIMSHLISDSSWQDMRAIAKVRFKHFFTALQYMYSLIIFFAFSTVSHIEGRLLIWPWVLKLCFCLQISQGI